MEAILQMSRIPDTIKQLANYDGTPRNLSAWLDSVDNVLALYENVAQGQPAIYNVWISTIKGKLIGKAADAVNSRHVDNDWEHIRAALVEAFGDRRDMNTLCQKMSKVNQGKKTLNEYYDEVSELNADIGQKVAMDHRFEGHVQHVMLFVNDLTRNYFIDGLNYPYNLLVRSSRPNSLEDAKANAEAQIQSNQRNRSNINYSYNNNRNSNRGNEQQRNFSNRNFNNTNVRNANGQNPQNQNMQPIRDNNFNQNRNFNRNFNRNVPQNNMVPARANVVQNNDVVPMEVDPSLRSRMNSNRSRAVNNVENIDNQNINFRILPDDQQII
jgi:hypothetical protein